jgi:transposase
LRVPDPEHLSRAELVARVRDQAVRLDDQARELEALRAENTELRARLDRLERLVSRNSGNSSMPPSTDDLPGRTPPAGKSTDGGGGAKRRRGKQPGAPGAYLAWRDDPDETLTHVPRGTCGCGADLADGIDLGVARSYQQHEVPQMSATCTQHDLYAVRCGCGRVHTAERPGNVADTPVSYGPNLQTWCVFLMVIHAIPVQRCAELVATLTGVCPSVGWVHGLLVRTADTLVQVDKRIRTLLTMAYAVCCDETPIRVGARRAKKYLLVACNQRYTWYHVGDRTLATFKDFGLGDLSGVVVHDRYQNYDSTVFGGLVHQLCTAHILRDLEDAAECYPHAHWPTQIADALRDLIHAANTARAAGHDAIDGQLREARLRWLRARGRRRIVRRGPQPGPERQAATRPLPAGDAARPARGCAAVCPRPVCASDQQPGRTRPAPSQDAAEDLWTAHLGNRHPSPLPHPRLPVHRGQARTGHDGCTSPGHRRPPWTPPDPAST